MKRKRTFIIILTISALVFAGGFYIKYLHTYVNGVQIQKTSTQDKSEQRQLNLGDAIDFIEQFEKTYSIDEIESSVNEKALNRFKTINFLSMGFMIISLFGIIWNFLSILLLRK